MQANDAKMEGVSTGRAILAVSMGDPVGVGPEVVVKALSTRDVRAIADVVVFGDPVVLDKAAAASNMSVEIREIESGRQAAAIGGNAIAVVPVSRLSCSPAEPTLATDNAQLDYVHRAARAVLSGEADALVTGPISKSSISRAGSRWHGHTEMLAELCEERGLGRDLHPVMMIAGERLKVVTLTTHIPISEVPGRVTRPLLDRALRIVDESWVKYFGAGRRPRIAVAGLNPHASEGGLFGSEEAEVITPAIEELSAGGLLVSGPFSADAIFRRALDGEFEVVVGMYHDQALTPVKLVDFDTAVNVTLGLPMIRTSVDHGTAYDLAGQGIASARSMIAALRMAASMATTRASLGEAA